MLVAVMAAQRERWGVTDELLAKLVEAVDLSNRMFLMAHTTEGTEVPEPVVIPRPGTDTVSSPEPRKATAAEMREFFGGSVNYTP
jgi:hypothetical protein